MAAGSKWLERANTLLRQGQARMGDVDALLADSEQFTWGGAAMDAAR